jgi:hypothetical protein
MAKYEASLAGWGESNPFHRRDAEDAEKRLGLNRRATRERVFVHLVGRFLDFFLRVAFFLDIFDFGALASTNT